MKTNLLNEPWRKRLKPKRQPEAFVLLMNRPAVALQKRPRAFAAAVEKLVLLLVALVGAGALIREVGPGVRPLERTEWERRAEKEIR